MMHQIISCSRVQLSRSSLLKIEKNHVDCIRQHMDRGVYVVPTLPSLLSVQWHYLCIVSVYIMSLCFPCYQSRKEQEFTVKVSYIEIYKEELQDLLDIETSYKDLHVREDEKGNTGQCCGQFVWMGEDCCQCLHCALHGSYRYRSLNFSCCLY